MNTVATGTLDAGAAPEVVAAGAAPGQDLLQLLREALGARFGRLHPQIRDRFALATGEATAAYVGVMQVVTRSRLGWLLARLLRPVRVLPHQRQVDVGFRFDVRPLENRLGWDKCRRYEFADEVFEFRSNMVLDAQGRLAERFAGGLGMYIDLALGPDRLMFLDRGYFLHLGRHVMALPAWLGPGRFRLVHRNLDADRFEVVIDIHHPWFGHLFHQRGEFARVAGERAS